MTNIETVGEIEQGMRSWLGLSPDDERPIGELAELMVKQARRHGGGGLLDNWFQKMADALQEASRTQSPADEEAEEEVVVVDELMMNRARRRALDATYNAQATEQAAYAASIPAPERSKEETGVNGSLITPHMLNAGSAQITVPSYDADDKKTLAVRVYRAMEAARLSSVLETPPLHKEGEIVGRSFLDELENKSGRKLYAAPVPVPVTITDDMVLAPKEPTEAMHNAARDWSVKKYGIGIGRDASDGCYKAMIAALSLKPGEQG